MNPTSLIPAAQSKALLREIDQQIREESRRMTVTAEREAHEIVHRAHATARQRMHEALVGLRVEGVRRLARAAAQIETESRQRAQQRAVAAIHQAWPLLVDRLVARWSDVAARRAWTDALARLARACLSGGTWTVEHPVGWSDEEQQRFRAVRGASDDTIEFLPDRGLAAGIRIRSAQVTLDGTPEGLLADNYGVAGMLLAEIDRPGDS